MVWWFCIPIALGLFKISVGGALFVQEKEVAVCRASR